MHTREDFLKLRRITSKLLIEDLFHLIENQSWIKISMIFFQLNLILSQELMILTRWSKNVLDMLD